MILQHDGIIPTGLFRPADVLAKIDSVHFGARRDSGQPKGGVVGGVSCISMYDLPLLEVDGPKIMDKCFDCELLVFSLRQ